MFEPAFESPKARAPLELDCRECGHTVTLDAAAQDKILGELRLPAARHILQCRCGRFQYALGVGPIRRREVTQ